MLEIALWRGGVQEVSALRKFLVQIRLLISDRKSTRLNSSHGYISYAVFCLKKKNVAHAPQLPPERAVGGVGARRVRNGAAGGTARSAPPTRRTSCLEALRLRRPAGPAAAAGPAPPRAPPRASRPRTRSRTASGRRGRAAAPGRETPGCPAGTRSARPARTRPPESRERSARRRGRRRTATACARNAAGTTPTRGPERRPGCARCQTWTSPRGAVAVAPGARRAGSPAPRR